MPKHNGRYLQRTVLIISMIFVAIQLQSHAQESEQLATGSLRALERRARQAQALAEQVESLQQELMMAKQNISSNKTEIIQLGTNIEELHKTIEVQNAAIAEQKEQIRRRDEMLRLFRSGEFEYYQVIEGDTLASIAENPMVYGDKTKAIWIAYANAMEPDTDLNPGTVLIIPRFTEGVNYGF